MGTHSFQLYKRPGIYKKGKCPCDPMLQVALKFWSETGNGIPLVSNQCVNFSEFQDEIARLRRELDEMERLGKRFLDQDEKRFQKYS
jgi:hypothetical protein